MTHKDGFLVLSIPQVTHDLISLFIVSSCGLLFAHSYILLTQVFFLLYMHICVLGSETIAHKGGFPGFPGPIDTYGATHDLSSQFV